MRNVCLTILISLFLLTVSYSQEAKDWGKKPTSFNNPPSVYTPDDNRGYFQESFEDVTFPPAGWTKANPDGGTGWTRLTVGTTPLPGWTGGVVYTPSGGGNAAAYVTWNTGGATSNDQYLITPQITNVQPGDSLSFWILLHGYSNAYADNVDIRISTTGTAPADFSTVVALLTWPAGTTDTTWTYHAYEFTNFVSAGSNIYVAFREHVADNLADGAAIFLDLVSANMFIPVELASFNASVSEGQVVLNWLTATETNNQGFQVQRKSNSEYQTISFIDGYGTTTNPQNYSFVDNNLQPGHYTYRLKQIDFDGTFEYSNEVEVDFKVPTDFSLSQNYPNPFNPSTKISFTLPIESNVTLKIFNLLGEEVINLLNGTVNAGYHNVNFDASNLNSGIYFYQIEAQGNDGSSFSEVKKMILAK
ncbi:MAG: hypothetical protein A2V93_12195 [Ignavibacteria bacterium RBG_16_34_14]|nr:MAG: hypothetical protein A2V93_12195 [Ignavibacteria bacterium RBG_16_34_14]